MTKQYKVAKYRRRRMKGRRGARRGKGFFKNLLRGVSKFGKSANRFLKKSRVISNLAPLFGERGKAIGAVARQAGYGSRKRRMVRGRRRGRGTSLAGSGIRLAGRGGLKKTYRGMSY